MTEPVDLGLLAPRLARMIGFAYSQIKNPTPADKEDEEWVFEGMQSAFVELRKLRAKLAETAEVWKFHHSEKGPAEIATELEELREWKNGRESLDRESADAWIELTKLRAWKARLGPVEKGGILCDACARKILELRQED